MYSGVIPTRVFCRFVVSFPMQTATGDVGTKRRVLSVMATSLVRMNAIFH